jgi:hypothetical protein
LILNQWATEKGITFKVEPILEGWQIMSMKKNNCDI